MHAKAYQRCLLFIPILFLLPAGILEAKVFDLYYLGGQSNMDGYGFVDELPGDLRGPVKDVMIFHGNTVPDGSEVDRKSVV